MERMLYERLKPSRVIGDVEVFVGKELLPSVPVTVKSLCDGGYVLLVCGKADAKICDRLSAEFKESGFKTYVIEDKSAEIPEYIRFVFGIGDGIEEAKTIAGELSVDCAALITSPNSDKTLSGYAPKQVYVDKSIISFCSRESVAAGWGIVLSEPLSRFEEYFAEKVLGEEINGRPTVKELPLDADEAELAVKLIELSALGRRKDNASVMADLLLDVAKAQGIENRLFGEYKFVCASVLSVFYGCFLGSPSIDCTPPPSHDLAIDEIVKLTGRKREMLINSFDFLPSNSYFRINYILGEYRLDLLERLKGIDLHSSQRRWRRLYPDAGYWLQRTFTANTLIRALRLSSSIGSGLLRYIGETGFAA